MVDVDGSFHVGALVESQVALLVVAAGRTMGERRDPGTLRLQRLGPLLSQRADEAATTALDSDVGVEDGVLWPGKTGLAELGEILLSGVSRLEVGLQWAHQQLDRQLATTLATRTCLRLGLLLSVHRHVGLIKHELVGLLLLELGLGWELPVGENEDEARLCALAQVLLDQLIRCIRVLELLQVGGVHHYGLHLRVARIDRRVGQPRAKALPLQQLVKLLSVHGVRDSGTCGAIRRPMLPLIRLGQRVVDVTGIQRAIRADVELLLRL